MMMVSNSIMKWTIVGTVLAFMVLTKVNAFESNDILTNPSRNDRLDCALIHPIDEAGCKANGCVYSPVEADGHTPWCFLNRSTMGYTVENKIENLSKSPEYFERELKIKPETKKLQKVQWIDSLKFRFDYLSEKIFRFKLSDSTKKRYEVPIQKDFNIPKANADTATKAEYEVTLNSDFGLVVERKQSRAKLIDTTIGGLLYGDQFLQFATRLASKNLFGLGENFHQTFLLDTTYRTYPIFARDRAPGNENDNTYGTHPFYMVVEPDGKAHGVLLLNSNAMAYTLLPEPAIVWKTTGGILDLFVFVGESPEEVIKLYTSVIGRPIMPPFWGLGFQLCRYGYKNTSHVEKVVKRNLDNNVPLDVLYMDIDYMDGFRDFTYDHKAFAELPQYVERTKKDNNLRWTLILDPAIEADTPKYSTFDTGLQKDVFIKWPKDVPADKRKNPPNVNTDHDIIYGKVWPNGPAAFPDFFKNVTKQWWMEQIGSLYGQLKFDALWIDMNEPSNFNNYYCPNSKYNVDYPQLKLEHLQEKTLCMDAVQGENGEYRHYDVHSLYGFSETEPTLRGLQKATGGRGFVVTRSTYVSSSRYAAHWLGDNSANWNQLRQSIVGMTEFSLFGFNFVGADICGFIGETNPELCRRWLQLGAYYPFSRSHNNYGSSDQDPGYWKEVGHPEVTEAAVKALTTRYQLLHYLYTRFYRSHVDGDTLVRSVMHEFPTVPAAFSVNYQFFLGSSILVCPFVTQNEVESSAYVPPGNWYKFSSTSEFLEPVVRGSNDRHIFKDDESHRPLLFREGSILPIVTSLPNPLNTFQLRKSPIELWILPNSTGHASGDLFWDDGESIESIENKKYNYFEIVQNKCDIMITAQHQFKQPIVPISAIKISVKHFDLEHLEHVEAILRISTKQEPTQMVVTINKQSNYLIIQPKQQSPIELKLLADNTTNQISIIFRNKADNKCFIH